MKFPLSLRIRALFAKDANEVYFAYLNDEERELREKDVWELARLIQEADVRGNMAVKKIVAEHLLSARVAQIQSKASWGAGLLGFLGAVLGAAISFAIGGQCS